MIYNALGVLQKIPDKFKGLIIWVDDFPDAATILKTTLKIPFDLLGSSPGVPLDRKGISNTTKGVNINFFQHLSLPMSNS